MGFLLLFSPYTYAARSCDSADDMYAIEVCKHRKYMTYSRYLCDI